jgi:hypothetical protein
MVDVEVLVLEQVDGDRFLRCLAQEIEQDEELAVMNTDLGNAAGNAERMLALGQGDDDSRSFGAQPAVDIELAATNVILNPGIHARKLTRSRANGNAAAMTVL